MACTLESPCLNTDRYISKLKACQKSHPNDVKTCMGLSNECAKCIEGIDPNDIHQKCCSSDPQEFVDDFFKKNLMWVIPVMVIGVLIIIVLIFLLISALFL